MSTRAHHDFAALRLEEPSLRVLDARGPDAFARGHLEGSGRLAPEELRSRRMELPAREVPLLVVHDDPAVAERFANQLGELGYARVWWLDRPLGSVPDGHTSTGLAARLWSPSAFVERAVAALAPGRALDLACGSGRAAVHLALLGHEVEAWDVDDSALELAHELATRHGVSVTTRAVDLETATPPPAPAQPFDLIVVVRYLHRPLFPWIEAALAPGGTLVLETFRRGQERFGHPTRDRHLLEPGELADAFPSLRVVEHGEDDGSRPPVLARLVAHRPRD